MSLDRKPRCYFDERGNKKNKHEYDVWLAMLNRCNNERLRHKNPSYKDCEIDEFFMCYENFYEWCNSQIGFSELFQLDKDLLVKGNKIYSPKNCVFVPNAINTAITNRSDLRGKYLIGVSYEKGRKKFVSRMSYFGKVKTLGRYETELEAFNAYKAAKEAYLKELAEIWKSKIDPRAYNALINYQVEITD